MKSLRNIRMITHAHRNIAAPHKARFHSNNRVDFIRKNFSLARKINTLCLSTRLPSYKWLILL